MSDIRLPQVSGDIRATSECTIVAKEYLLSMAYDAERDGFIYHLAQIGIDDRGDFTFHVSLVGIVSGAMPGDEGIIIAAAGALPDGYGDYAVIISDRKGSIDGHGLDDVAAQYDLSAREFSDLIRKAWRIAGNDIDSRLWSRAVGLTDCDGRVIGIGSWVQAGDEGRPHRVVGVGINEFHGPMVMVDDAVSGDWFALTAGTKVVTDPVSTWEEFVEVAGRGDLTTEELVKIAKRLANADDGNGVE